MRAYQVVQVSIVMLKMGCVVAAGYIVITPPTPGSSLFAGDNVIAET